MKVSFKAFRGHNYHIVHETKTGHMRKSCWTICDEYFDSGERSNRSPTCPNCVALDNPLKMLGSTISVMQLLATKAENIVPARSTQARELLKRDYINAEGELTRRGMILAEDYTLGAIPMQGTDGLMHARLPLYNTARCSHAIKCPDAEDMTVSRYEKLRKVYAENPPVITCLECLSLPLITW